MLPELTSGRAPRRWPLSFLIPTGLGLASGLAAALSLSGQGALLHPALADTGAGIALLVSAIALIGTGAFPLVIARLMRADAARSAENIAGESVTPDQHQP